MYKEFELLVKEERNCGGGRRCFLGNRHDAREVLQLAGGITSESLWTSTCAITKRSYWTRVWVVQETILAKRLLIFCGGISFSGKTYASFSALHNPQSEVLSAGTSPDDELSIGFQQTMTRWALRRQRGEDNAATTRPCKS